MTKQIWTLAVSAVLFMLCAALIIMLPVPYVTWLPGGTYDLLATDTPDDPIQVGGVDTYPTSGQLRMTTVSVTSSGRQLSLPEVVAAYWLPSREVLPRQSIYPAGVSTEQISAQDLQRMSSSKSDAAVAALRAANIPVEEYPMVTAVAPSGPSLEVLIVGDLIAMIDDTPTPSVQSVVEAVSDHHVGDAVVVTVLRSGITLKKTVTTRASAKQADEPILGVTLGLGHLYGPSIRFGINADIGGSSAGLTMALAIYAKLSPTDLLSDRVVAGTGTIDSDGNVGAIGGVQEKIAAAERDQATIFLLPEANCVDAGKQAGIRLVPVSSLREAITALETLKDPTKEVKGC
ncbi:MAG: PDZ domain-containing protein [Propionibacteriaceae bacterium]|jgi:PDZ domain-containing protein|nr:PDZ domain-containing protein [Propionibacteriaceae bacterium]